MEINYRNLTEGEIIKGEDEYLGSDGKWYAVINFIGNIYNKNVYVTHRRKLSDVSKSACIFLHTNDCPAVNNKACQYCGDYRPKTVC